MSRRIGVSIIKAGMETGLEWTVWCRTLWYNWKGLLLWANVKQVKDGQFGKAGA